MYFHKYSKYKPSNSSICENYIKPFGIFWNYISKCPYIRRKRIPISLHRVPAGRSNKVKTYSISVGSPCIILVYPCCWWCYSFLAMTKTVQNFEFACFPKQRVWFIKWMSQVDYSQLFSKPLTISMSKKGLYKHSVLLASSPVPDLI